MQPAMVQTDGGSFTTADVKQLDAPENGFAQSSKTQSPDSYPAHSTYDAALHDEFAGMDEDCLLGEPTIVKESRKQDAMVEPPALPQKSSLRASRILHDLKLSSIESATQSLTTPHDAYMSSEEDASSSADEFSEDDCDSCSEASQGSPVRRKSYEDTARVVSFIYSGKPFLVELPSPRRSTASSTADASSESGSLVGTPSESPVIAGSHPPRKCSLVQYGHPSFLKNDPYAKTHVLDVVNEDIDGAQRTSKAASSLTRVQRTLSLVRKRSRPFLRTNSSISISKEDISSPSLSLSQIHLPYTAPPTQESTPELGSPVESIESNRPPVRYSDIINSARKSAATKSNSVTALPPVSPMSPLMTKRGFLSGLKSNRRQSFKS